MKLVLTLLIIVMAVFALICLIMSITFVYAPWVRQKLLLCYSNSSAKIVYPNDYVNVYRSPFLPNNTRFQMRCDLAANEGTRFQLLALCNFPVYTVAPYCEPIGTGGAAYGMYSFGEVQCLTGYLDRFTATEDFTYNKIALASWMMVSKSLLSFSNADIHVLL